MAWPATDWIFHATSELLPKALPQKGHSELLKRFSTSQCLDVCWTCALPSARPPVQTTAFLSLGGHKGLTSAVAVCRHAFDGLAVFHTILKLP